MHWDDGGAGVLTIRLTFDPRGFCKKILIASYSEQHLPRMWKLADVTPLPKKKPVNELKKDLRPISFTPCISRVIEGFIVDDYVKPAVMSVIDDSQYGAIPNSSTTMALISKLYN